MEVVTASAGSKHLRWSYTRALSNWDSCSRQRGGYLMNSGFKHSGVTKDTMFDSLFFNAHAVVMSLMARSPLKSLETHTITDKDEVQLSYL